MFFFKLWKQFFHREGDRLSVGRVSYLVHNKLDVIGEALTAENRGVLKAELPVAAKADIKSQPAAEHIGHAVNKTYKLFQ